MSFITLVAFAQKHFNNEDSLYKYSYLIYGYVPKTTGFQYTKEYHNGTGFFIKNQKKTYLVTNFHVLAGWNTILNLEEKSYPEVMSVRVDRKDTAAFDLIPIKRLSFTNKDLLQGVSSVPDIYFYEIKIPKYDTVYTLEKLIEQRDTVSNYPDSVVVFGYPTSAHNKSETYLMNSGVSKAKLTFNSTLEGKSLWEGSEKDTINYALDYNQLDLIGSGSSGSPVYFINKIKKKGEIIREIKFGGVVWGQSQGFFNNLIFVIKQNIMQDMIKNILD
jgi:hypothetical protein